MVYERKKQCLHFKRDKPHGNCDFGEVVGWWFFFFFVTKSFS